VPIIGRRLARRLDALSRRAHRFHRFAHHPLCDEYAAEVVLVRRRARICRGCLFTLLGIATGWGASLVSPVSIAIGAGLLLVASSWLVVTAARTGAARRSKLSTRFAPGSAMGFAVGMGIRTGGSAGVILVSLTVLICVALAALYRRRGPDRSPCARCPERALSTPCRGFVEIVNRERAFQRLARRMLLDVR
jgi:hypothetical protein